jgi:hypothetical protein
MRLKWGGGTVKPDFALKCKVIFNVVEQGIVGLKNLTHTTTLKI